MKVIAVTQARYSSSRLPGKVLRQIGSKTLLQIHLERAKRSTLIDKLVVATTTESKAGEIASIAENLGCAVYRGSMDNVLDRVYQAVKTDRPDYVVRITSDCPLLDAELVDRAISECASSGVDYCSNTLDPTFPDGMDVEVMRFSALEKAWKEATLSSEKEHVTPFIWKNSSFYGKSFFTSKNVASPINYSQYRLTVDEPADFELIKELVNQLGDEAKWMEYVALMQRNPGLNANKIFKRNEGLMKSIETDHIILRTITNFANSDAYRRKIHDLIPGGAHTYSKGDDQFPLLSPAAIEYGKGAYVWDVDGNKFLDCSMGLTSVSLGHAYESVIETVKSELDKGVNFQRPAYLESLMAEKFLSLIPQHQMVKFAKNGSIVTTAAVKLARAYTGRKLVAFPFDHPFYSYDDWFIGKTQCNLGVPDEITSLSVTYKSDDLSSLEELFNKYPGQIACVISEPEKNWGLPENYLSDAIDLAHKHGSLYIVDEMITGFKTAFPGSITKYNVSPDMATWGKGIANGFSFCALTGKKEVMELGGIRNTGSEKVFLISTTHGGETHSIAAGLATIETFEKENVIAHNHSIGDYFLEQCKQVIDSLGMNDFVQLAPCNWMPVFVFRDKDQNVCAGLRTLAMQEMIRRGILFQGAFVPCFSHSKEDIDYFAAALHASLIVYKKAMDEGYKNYLVGEPAKAVFRKYL